VNLAWQETLIIIGCIAFVVLTWRGPR